MTDVSKFKEILKKYKKENIVFSFHARLRMEFRQIDEKEVIENILNPKRLEVVRETNNHRYECYFMYSNTKCHKYVLVTKKKLIIVTVIKINRRWQRYANKKARTY